MLVCYVHVIVILVELSNDNIIVSTVWIMFVWLLGWCPKQCSFSMLVK